MGLYDKFDPFAGVDIDVDELHREAKAMDAAIAARPEPIAPQPASSTFRRIAGDTAITALKGAIGLPEAAVGIADIATGGRTGKALETIGYRPAEAKEILSDFYTPEQKAAFGRVSQADGFVPTLQALAEDPSVAAHSVVESLPSMLGGAGVARSALKVAPKLAPWVAGAAGEGVISAGQAAESIRQESADGLLTPKQAGLSVLAGGGVGLTSGVAGKLATKLGIADIDTMLASGNRSAINKSILRQIGESALSEGVLEEMPQSAWEQVLQNVALDRPWYEGVGSSSAQGFVAGGLMGAAGGGFNALGSRPSSETVSATNQKLPVPPATSQASGLPAGGGTPPGGAIDDPSITPPIAGARDMGDIPEFGGPMVAREAAPAAPVSNGPIGMALAAGGITSATMYQDFAANPFAEAPVVQPGGPAIAGQQVSDLLNAAKAPTELEQATRWADAVIAQGGGAATAVMNLRAADRNGRALVSEWKRRTKPQAIAGVIPAPGDVARDSQSGKTTQVDQAAHAAATSPTNSLPEPSTAQIEAGNYKKGHLKLHGLDISVENPAGSIRKGVDETGKEWQTTLAHHYGYIKGTVGRDKDHIDIFVGPQSESGKLYVVDQLNTKTGKFDEHKVMAGFASAAEAQTGYLANYDQTGPQRIGNITETTPEQFKQWLNSGNTKQAFASQASSTKTVASQKQRNLNDKRRSVKPDQDDLIVAIAKLGGLNREQATAQWGSTLNDMVRDLNLHATKNGKAGFLHAIAKTGRNLDEMRELLEEYGYLQPGSSIEDMYAKIEAATRGQQSYSNQREYREDEAYPFDLDGINFPPSTANPKRTSQALRNVRRDVRQNTPDETGQGEGVAGGQNPAQRDTVKHRAFLQRMLAQARTPKAKKQIKRALERLDAKAQQLNTQPDAGMYRDLAGFKTQPDSIPVGTAATADSEALAAEIESAVLTPSGTFAMRKTSGRDAPQFAGAAAYPGSPEALQINEEVLVDADQLQAISDHFDDGEIHRLTSRTFFQSGTDSGNPSYGHRFKYSNNKPLRGVTSFAINADDDIIDAKVEAANGNGVLYAVRPQDVGGKFVVVRKSDNVLFVYAANKVDTTAATVVSSGRELQAQAEALTKEKEELAHEIAESYSDEEIFAELAALGVEVAQAQAVDKAPAVNNQKVVDGDQEYIDAVSKRFEEKFEDAIFEIDEDQQKKNLREGMYVIDRIPQEAERAALKGKLGAAARIAGRSSGTDIADAGQGKTPGAAAHQVKVNQAQALTAWAKEHDLLIDSAEFSRLWAAERIQGAEHDVYFTKDDRVIKRLSPSFTTWMDYFNRVALHNWLFPDTAYDLKGFMLDNGKLFAVVEQPFIKQHDSDPVTDADIFKDTDGMGFTHKPSKGMSGGEARARDFYRNDGVVMTDLHDANVFRAYDGTLAYIDAIIWMDHATKRQRLMQRYGLQEKQPRSTAKHKAFLQRMLQSAKSDKARETARKALQRLEARTKPIPATIDDEINSMSLDDMAALFSQAASEAAAPATVRNRAKLQEARRKFLAKQLAKSREPNEQRRLQAALGKLQAAQVRLRAEQLPEQPRSKPDKDESTDPYFKKGDRVQFANGVHGEVIEVTSYTWQSAVIDVDGSGLVVKKTEERPSHSYKVRKDNGVEVNGWFNEMFKESEPVPNVVPGPVFDGKTYDPDALLRSITYKRNQIDGAVSHADRSRKPEKKAAWQKDAESFRKEASGMQAAFDAWAKQYPEEADKYAPQVQPSVSPAPAAAGTGIEGLKVTFNTEKNGIELRFNSKPDDAILAKIKANGFTWGKARRVWYTKDTPAKRAFVEELQGKGQAKAEAEKPKTNADKMREAGAAAFAAGRPRIPQDPWIAGAEISAGMKEAWLKGWDAANLASPAAETKTIWNNDGTDGPILITAPPAKPSLDEAVELAENEITEKIKRAKRRLRDAKDPLQINAIELEISKLRREIGRVDEKVRAEYTSSTRSAADILGAAAKSGVKGADEALKGLYELFGGKSLKSFPGAVDENTYQAAKPHFTAALENFRAAGKSLKEFFSFLIDQFGAGIQPYVMKYMEEKQHESGILQVTDQEAVDNDNTTDGGTGKGSLESGLPRTVSDVAAERQTEQGSGSVSRTDDEGDGNTDEGGNVRSGSLASQPESVHTQPGEGSAGSAILPSGATGSVSTPSEPRTPNLTGDNPGNYRITAADDLGGGTRGDKINNNLAAIRLVKQLDKEGRYPTRAEQAVLVKYVGWGGLKSVFDPNSTKPQDQKARTELEQLLTEAEYFEARQSVLNAHYTSPEIIGSIYNILQHMGFTGGNVLEPTYGSGNFIGLMPESMAAASKWYGSELDPVTSKIGKFLYPDAQLLESGFQDAEFPYGKFDLAIGNPPFGAEQITDTNKKRAEIDRFKIHNYVIAKSGMHLRPGGVMAMVVTSRFMDTANPEARDYLAKQFKFLTAIRLPNDAFAKNAGTEVTTDLVFFQKLMPGESAEDQKRSWLETGATLANAAGEEITLNKWFAMNPELMLGEPSMKGTMYGGQWRKEDGKGEFTLNARPGQDTTAEIGKLLQDDILFGKVKDIFTTTPDKADAAATSIQMNREDIGIGGYVEENGNIFMRGDDDQHGNPVFTKLTADTPWTEKQTLGETRLSRIKGMLDLRKAAYDLIEAERFDLSDMEAKRKELNQLYDAFVSKHGFLSDSANASLMADDVKIESGLEVNYRKAITAAKAKTLGVKAQPAKADKAAIMKQRVFFPVKEITSAANSRDGYGISLSEKGRLDLAYIAGLTGQTTDEVIKELADEGLIFKDPATGTWKQEDEYLSGNVKAKLTKVLGREGFEKNVEALTAVLPKDVTPEEIFADLGATWIPAEVYKEFADLMGVTNANVLIIPETGTVKIISGGHVQNDMNVMLQNQDHDVASLINHIAAKQAVVAYDHVDDGNGGSKRVVNKDRTKALVPMVKRVSATFRDWLMADPRRATELTKIYNDTMNTHAPRTYNGKHLKTVGASPAVRLRNSQRNAAWRMLQSPVVLLDHVVGAGKTFTIITGVMERKRLGLSSKSMIVVPNHLVGQWGADFLKLYPGARILATTEKDFAKANRKRLFARIATGNYDAVIVGHSSFGFIPLEAETQREFVMEEISYLERALMMAELSKDKRLIRNLTEKIAKKRERIKSLMNKERDDVVTFENMGVDNLVVDESHEFKNLEYSTSMQNITGMGNPNGAKKSFDLYAKIQYLRGKDGAITFATGTPISNSLVEMYTILRYLNRQGLKDRNLDVFDSWAKAYASIESRIEYTPSQKLKDRQVMATFNNLPELLQLYSEFADVIGMKDLKRIYAEQIKESNKETGANEREEFPVPKVKNGARYLDVADPTPAQRQYMDYLVARANRLEKLGGQNDPKTDNHLWLMNDARKMALDIRLVDPTAPSDPNNKVNRAANNIKRIYDQWHADKGTQLVFCDLSTPAGSSKSEAAKFIKNAQAVIGMEKDKALSTALSSLTYTEQWAYLKNRIEREVERLDQAEQNDANEAAREKLEKFLESVGDEEISTLNTVDTGFSVYDDLKATLIAKGIPANEIRFIHEANTRDQKTELFNMVNSGLVRVLIGSSRKMGAGTNVQERLVALHHMDAPWRPSDIEQREGRIIRQGNILYERDPDNFEVEILAYSTRNTFDSVSWQILARKAEMLEDFRSGARSMQDSESDAASYSEFMAESTGNPIFREKFKLEREIEELESTERNIMARRAAGERIVRNADADIAKAEKTLQAALRDMAEVKDAKVFEVDGKKYADDLTEAYTKAYAEYETASKEYTEKLLPEYVAAMQLLEEQELDDKAKKEAKKLIKKPLEPTKPTLPRLEKTSQAARAALRVSELLDDVIDRGEVEFTLGGSQVVIQKVPAGNGIFDFKTSINGTNRWGLSANGLKHMSQQKLMELFNTGEIASRVAADLRVARAAVESVKQSIDDAERTLSKLKFEDAGKLKAMQERYKAVVEEVNQLEKDLDKKREQEANVYISGDGRRFGSDTPVTSDKKDAVVFARGGSGARGLDVADVNKAASAIISTFPGSPQVSVVKNFAALPKAIQAEAIKQEVGESFPGVLDSKQAFVLADNLDSFAHLETVLLHEIMGHYSIKQLFGSREIEKLNDLFHAMGGVPGLLKLARENQWDTVTAYARGFAKAGYDAETRKALMVHELLAHQAQVKRPALIKAIKEYIGAIKAWLREHGFTWLPKTSTNDLAYVLRQAREVMTSPADMTGGMHFMTDWHGNPHDQAKYSLASTPPSGLKAVDLQREFAGLPFASRVKVVQSSSDLPGGGPNSLLLRVEGQYKDGVIYLVADNLPSAERAKVVALGHELTHAGQSAKLLDMAVQWFRSAQAKGDNGSAFQKAAMIILRQEALKRGYNIIKPDDFKQAVQEATAVIAETAYRTGESNGLLKRLLMHLKHFMKNTMGIKSLPFTDTELVAVVVEMMAQGQRNMTNGTGPDGEIHYSLASTAAEAVADIDWHAMADQVRNNWKQTVNPLDFSRTAGWFDDWTPENIKAAFGYLFAVPHFQAERDQAKRVFVNNAESREIERMDLMLQFLGYNPGEGDTRTTSERMKDFLTKWESGQAHTDWEKINQAWAKLPKDQQAAFDALMVEGDANNSRYSYLKQALTNPRIARTKPNQTTFDLYLQVRNHIDNHVKEARINALERMMLESGMDKARVDKHISDFRNELREVRGWFTRSHGEGDQVVNVYHKIDKTRFMQDWATVQVGDNKQQAKLKYYPGKDIAEAVYQIAAEHEYTVAPMAHGGLVVTTTAGADLDAFYQQLAERVDAVKGDILVKRYARYQWTKGAAARHAEEIQADLKKAMPHNYRPEHEYVVKVQPVDKLTEELYQEMKSDFAVEQALTQTAEKALQRGDMSKEEYRKFKVDLVQDTAEVLMGRAAGRYQIRRAPYLIEGYDTSNTLSLYQDYMMGVAGMLSKADYARKQFEAYRAADTKVKPWAAKYIFDGLRNQGLGDRISGNLRAFASLWYMGLKPASALINATQIYTLGYAELGRYVKSPLKHIARASRDVVAGRLTADEELIFKTAVYKQQEMASAMGEITGHNEGTTGKAGKLLRAVTSKSLALFQNVEVVNRKAMILAAYRTLKNQDTRAGVIDQEAFEKAITINDTVNFNMHRGNLPGWARGPVGRTMYALQSFTFNTLNWMFNRMTSGEQRDMIALLRYAGAITVLGGVAALPGGDELDKLYRRLFGKSVKLEFQYFTRKNLKQYGMVGEMVDSFAWHGAAGAAGVNISNSMRLQLPVISQVLSGETVSESATGVFGGLVRKGDTALTAAAKGDWYRATEAAAPEAISGVMRAARQYNRGVTTLSGKQVYDEQGQPLKYSAADAALRGLGLQPLDQLKRTETTWIGRELAAEWNSQRQDQIDALRIAKTPEDRRAAVRAIMNWNRELQASQVWGLVLPISAKTISNAMNPRISGTDKRRAAWQQSRLQ